MNQEELLKSLMELDFIAVDLGLFLNTHPDDSDAIAAYNHVITEIGRASCRERV